MIFVTLSFLWWLSIVKAALNVKKKKRLAHGTNTLLIEIAFIFVLAFLVRGRKRNWNRINKLG